MNILGLSTMGGSAASIMVDGVIVAAIEEERLTRIKNDGGFPYKSIELCLEVAGLSISDIDEVAVYWKPWRFLSRAKSVISGMIKNPESARFLVERSIKALFGLGDENKYPELRGSWVSLFKIKSLLTKNFGKFSAKVRYYDHHDCHAASIYYLTSFDQSICLTYDGGGESASTVLYAIDNDRMERLKTISWPNSLGHFYSAFTGFLGFRMLEGEYKMMGLAPYGKAKFKDIILDKVLQRKDEGGYQLNTKILNYHMALHGQFSKELIEIFGRPRGKDEEFTSFHKDIAASVQAAYEEVFLGMLSWAKSKKPDYANLCIAGGCGLNVTANGKVVKNKIFNQVLIPPAPHDAGAAIGACFLAGAKSGLSRNDMSMPSPYLGKEYNDHEIKEAFLKDKLPLPKKLSRNELIDNVSGSLASQEVVAWFQGRSEFGPRALGARSFLADPRNDSIREVLNSKIKKRELFRPFAPSCKKEVAAKYFELSQESPYMNIVARVVESEQKNIPAVTHTDKTARVHTVGKDANSIYWDLIDSFERKTGVGVLLNTSFNIQEPIVENPSQAIECFLKSSVDKLAIGSYLCDQEWRNQVESL